MSGYRQKQQKQPLTTVFLLLILLILRALSLSFTCNDEMSPSLLTNTRGSEREQKERENKSYASEQKDKEEKCEEFSPGRRMY